MEDGEMSEDEVVDSIMGYDSEQQLSEVQLQYREKLKRKIAKVCLSVVCCTVCVPFPRRHVRLSC